MPGRFGDKTTKATIEFRLAVVHRCMIRGEGSDDEILAALTRQGHVVSKRTIRKYVKTIRDRLSAETEEIRALRKAALIKRVHEVDAVMLSKLIDGGVSPAWKDLVKLLELRGKIESGTLLTKDESQDRPVDPVEAMTDEQLKALVIKTLGLPNFEIDTDTVH